VDAPIITIFVRHSLGCPHSGDAFYKRCDCWKHLRWTQNGRQYFKKTKSKTWAGAERVKREMELSFQSVGKPVVPNQPATIKQAVETFVQDKQGQNLSVGVLGKFRRELGRLVEFCEHQNKFYLSEIALPDLTKFRSSWESDYPSSITRQRVQARLKAFFRYSHSAGFTPQGNPAVDMSAIKVKEVPTLPLTEAEYTKLLEVVAEEFPDAVRAARVRALIRCMRFTGLAIRDAVTLERSEIQYDPHKKVTRIVTSRAKTGVNVSVPIPPDVAKELLAVVNGDTRYVFWQTGNGKPTSAVTNWQHDLRAVFHRAGMPKGHPHQLRDTAAVEWLNAGLPLEEVSKLLGHTSIKTTEKHYAPWVKSRQDRLDTLVMDTWKTKVS